MVPADPPRFSGTDAVTDADYNKRWHDIWDGGLEAGQVCALCLTLMRNSGARQDWKLESLRAAVL